MSWIPGRIDLFVRGTGLALYHRWYSVGWSAGWERVGGVLMSAPTVFGRANPDLLRRRVLHTN
jgi:hypothetical protein